MSIRPLIALIAFHAFIADAQEKSTAPATPAPPAPVPTHADVSFGPHPHQLIDIYLPKKGTAPFPALLWFGGIWKAAKHPANLGFFEQQGIAVIAVERRTMEDATAAKDADIAAALKAKGADITETKGVVAGVAFRDCSALGAGDYALLRQLAQLKSLSLGKG